MKQELTWGAAAAVAIVAAVGISSQPAIKTSATASAPAIKSAVRSKPSKGVQAQCAESIALLEHFFLHGNIAAPETCYDSNPGIKPEPDFQPNFVIATFPDPLHTHFSLLFDRFIEAIQQGAQDEGYEYDSSWLPWETEEPSLALLDDQDKADDRKTKREDQPGILLFRNANDLPYKKALIVFIVGEEPTRGIHRTQFVNAVSWIDGLRKHGTMGTPVTILGPTFSGSLPSLTELLSDDKLLSSLKGDTELAIYTGSATSREAGKQFAKTKGIDFRSFLQDDETVLDRFCRYLGGTLQEKLDLSYLAILSEDETAYGNIVAKQEAELTAPSSAAATEAKDDDRPESAICPGATRIYYPRDISTLRAAYQSQSMFSSTSTQQSQDNSQRKSLPTDLADPGGEQHDTVRTYAGNQTPLSQEAQLLGIVEALRAHRAQYVLLRSSNTLDPLFLANFLRRDFPEARVVVLNSDLLFQRGQDAMALSGVMTLSTYPLFSRAREWTSLPPYDAHSHRVFPENSTEGTYIASRLLLQSMARANRVIPALSCEFSDKDVPNREEREIFAPSLRCRADESKPYAPLPDYSPPYWTEPQPCDPNSTGSRCRPATWLSVITKNGTWPLAVLNGHTLSQHVQKIASVGAEAIEDSGSKAQAGRQYPSGHPSFPGLPRSMKVLLVSLCGLAVFHSLCCGFASFTAKPAFRAHFATAGRRHTGLVLIGSYLVALMALFTGWGCGIFSVASSPQENGRVWVVVVFVCLVVGIGMIANILVTKRLNVNSRGSGNSAWRIVLSLPLFGILLWAFFRIWVQPIEGALLLASRAFAYWRSMNLTSEVSPIVPFLSLTVGLYFWFWYALHGLALFGPDRPRLPPLSKLGIKVPGCSAELKLSMFSQEKSATPAELTATPLSWNNIKLTLLLFTSFAVLVACFVHEVPVRSLGARKYAAIYCFALDFYFSLILTEAWQIWRTWSCARQLLVFLDRLVLRRTLGALRGFSWGSVWKMSGNVLDVRYKLLSRQLECLTHLHTSLSHFVLPASSDERAAFSGTGDCLKSIDASLVAGTTFGKWYSENYNDPKAAGLDGFKYFQKQVAETTGVVLTELLIPASRMEKRSLIQIDPDDKGDGDRKQGPQPSHNELIRNAEELVCLTYLGFAQNLLGRIRTIVLGGVYLFIAATIAVSSYPFDPRPVLSGVLLFVFVAFGAVIVFAYADMHRDATLSHVTNTNPGELGSEFWLKLLGYGAAPALGLITQIFPEWSSFLFSWLQPGLSSLK